jgi:hypothetical protein
VPSPALRAHGPEAIPSCAVVDATRPLAEQQSGRFAVRNESTKSTSPTPPCEGQTGDGSAANRRDNHSSTQDRRTPGGKGRRSRRDHVLKRAMKPLSILPPSAPLYNPINMSSLENRAHTSLSSPEGLAVKEPLRVRLPHATARLLNSLPSSCFFVQPHELGGNHDT